MNEHAQIEGGLGGFSVTTVKKGTSRRKPKTGEVVVCHYEGRLQDGTVFDSSRYVSERCLRPRTFHCLQ